MFSFFLERKIKAVGPFHPRANIVIKIFNIKWKKMEKRRARQFSGKGPLLFVKAAAPHRRDADPLNKIWRRLVEELIEQCFFSFFACLLGPA